MKGKKKNKIVFVCTGNTCRSPMAEVLFRREIAPLGLKGLLVCSAGIKANETDTINEKSALVLKEQGFEDFEFHSTQISEQLIHESIAIVCMTEAHKDWLMDFRWRVLRDAGAKTIENNVYSFEELTGYEIIDPYGKDMDCYRYVYTLLSGGMRALKEKLLTPKVRQKFLPKAKTERKPRKKKAEQTAKKEL
jgi:protein-tyrosine phosphatase